MARVYTYSFEDTSLTISHPGFGTYTAYGTGLGNISVSYANDVTQHTVAADLAVVVSKWAAKNGTVNLEILQSSDFNEWLKLSLKSLLQINLHLQLWTLRIALLVTAIIVPVFHTRRKQTIASSLKHRTELGA